MEPVSVSKVNIFHLPDEILFEIMKRAGCCSKTNHEIRLVCKHFYRVYCDFTSCGLRIQSNKICNDVFDSMIHSWRRPSRLNIENCDECSKSSKLYKIIERFAVHIRRLEFSQSHEIISLADFEYIMRSMINVEEVTFSELNIHGHPKGDATNSITMPMLKKLVLINCDEDSVAAVPFLDASLLEEFHAHIYTEDVIDYTQFFEDHKTIRYITMSGNLQNAQAFKHLQLIKLQAYNDGNVSFLRDVIADQPKLKYLNLLPDQELPNVDRFDEDEDPRAMVTNDVFTVICKLKELETLKIGMGLVTLKAIGEISNLENLKELVIMPFGEDTYFDNYYESDVNKMRNDVHFKKCFQRLIAIPLPKLESFTWSRKNCRDNRFLMSDNEELMEFTRQREYSSFTKVDIVKTMAPSFPNLIYLKIEIKPSDDSIENKPSDDCINVRDILKQFPHLETLHLKVSSTFKGGSISMHKNIKHVMIDEIERNFLIEMMGLMPNLESFKIRYTQYLLSKSFLQNLQAAIPDSLNYLKLNFDSQQRQDFAVENIVILQNIMKKLGKCEIKLTGNCNFDRLAEKIDSSVGVFSTRTPRSYIPWYDNGRYMQFSK